MSRVLNNETGEVEEISREEAAGAVASGSYAPVADEQYDMFDRQGRHVSIPGSSVAEAIKKGYSPKNIDYGEAVADAREAAQEDVYGGISQSLQTGVEGLARGATFGASDVLLGQLDREGMAARQEVNPNIAIGTELVGAIAPSFLSGGSGLAATVARSLPSGALAARAGALGAKLGGGLKGAVVAGGLEGSVFGAGQAVSQLALQDEPLTAEAVFSEIGTQALLGAGLGAAGGALGAGLEKAGAGMAKLSNKVQQRLVKQATPALDAASKEGKALMKAIRSSTDDLDEVVERAVAKAESRSASGFRFAADDDVAEASFRALQRQKGEALDYATAASSRLPNNVEKAAARVEQAEQKIASLLSNKRGTLDFSKASSLDQKKLSALARSYDDYNASVAKLASETGVPFAPGVSPVSSGIQKGIDGAGELAASAKEAHSAFKQKLGKKGVEGLVDQTPEQAMETIRALQDATDKATVLARQVGGKEADSLLRIHDDIAKAVGATSSKKLPEVAELALALGVEEAVIPDVDGPADELLKLYLATKLVGKFGGAGGLAEKALSKGASKLPFAKLHGVADGFVSDTIGKLASAGGRASERISQGLQKSLSGATRAVKRSAPLTTQILHEVKFGEQGESKKPRGKQAAFELRSEELSSAVANMPAVEQRIHERLEGIRQVAPGVAEKVAAHTKASLEFLHGKMPKDPGTLQHFGQSRWKPTDAELDKFSRYVRAVKDPGGIMERFGNMEMTREDAEVLRTLYPAHFRKAQLWIADNLDKLQERSSFRQRVQLSLLMGVPADPIMARAAAWQRHFEPAQPEQAQPRQSPGGSDKEGPTTAQQLTEARY